MLFLETDLAVFSRLTGAPLDQHGRPRLDSVTHRPMNTSRILPPDVGGGRACSWGVRIPILKHPQDLTHYLTSADPAAVRSFTKGFEPRAFRQIPVFSETLEGRKWADIWPCVTFSMIDFKHRPGTDIYCDPYITYDTGAQLGSVSRDGVVIATNRARRTVRPAPTSWDVLYEVNARAKSKIELSLITAQLQHLLPPKGAIDVEWANGEVHTCDMLIEDSITLPVETMSLGAEEQAGYRTVLTYKIEAYFDNTTAQFGYDDYQTQSNLILQRVLELQDLQEHVFSQGDTNDTFAGIPPV